MLVAALSQTIVATALPTTVDELGGRQRRSPAALGDQRPVGDRTWSAHRVAPP
jgi:hypothetical protein